MKTTLAVGMEKRVATGLSTGKLPCCRTTQIGTATTTKHNKLVRPVPCTDDTVLHHSKPPTREY